jgi:hypothetical protein
MRIVGWQNGVNQPPDREWGHESQQTCQGEAEKTCNMEEELRFDLREEPAKFWRKRTQHMCRIDLHRR